MAEATFLFADIAGFTALTEAHGDEHAAAFMADFEDQVSGPVSEHGGELVKTIGDALMLRVPEPSSAVRLGLAIAIDCGREHGAPPVRVGMHHGDAVERGGDYIGSAVNLAARVSGVASGGEVLLTEAIRDGAGELSEVVFRPHGTHELRNVREPVRLFAALREGTSTEGGHPLDPVCRMAIDPDRAAGQLTYEGAVYYFCSLDCAGQFAARPSAFLRESR